MFFKHKKNHQISLFLKAPISARIRRASKTIGMGLAINISYEGARFPGLSPDDKYLFFTRYDENWNEDIYWVDARIIDEIKLKELK